MLRRPQRSTLFPYNDALPIWSAARSCRRWRKSTAPGSSSTHAVFKRRKGETPMINTTKRMHGSLVLTAILALAARSEEHTSELQSQFHLVCRLLLEKKKTLPD